MKKIVVGILIGFLFVFAGCNDDDGYSMSDMWIGFGIYQGDENSSKVVMDNKDVLVPVASNYPPGWATSLDNGDRVLVNYTILDEKHDDDGNLLYYYVKVNSFEEILMKGVMEITPENADSIGNDAIIVDDYWMTDSLLSFKLKYWGYNKIHFLNLVKKPSLLMSPGIQPYELELRHNANNDEHSILYTAYVSFSLNSLRIDGQDSVKVVVKATDYDGEEFSEEMVFNYANLPDVITPDENN